MAQVKYTLFYRLINPATNEAITNKTTDLYDSTTKFERTYPFDDSAKAIKDIEEEQKVTNSKYGMIFRYDGVLNINTAVIPNIIASKSPVIPYIYGEKFARCKGDVWFVASNHTSLQSAMKAAEPLIRSLTKENVKLCKNVSLDMTLILD